MHMQTRIPAAATALLLTAMAGLAAVTPDGAAQAGATHPSARAPHLTVTIKGTKTRPKLSTHTFRPGNTVFRVERKGTGGLIQVLRLKPGYSLQKASQDFAAAFGNTPDVAAIRRIDRKVVFYGGMETPRRGDP